MRVGFYTVFRHDPQHYVLAEALIRSVHAVMPGVPVVQLSDETSPKVLGVDVVIRRPNGKMLERRIEHYAACQGEWLLLDTDTMVNRDVRAVFDDEFDIAIADRAWPHLPQDFGTMTTMPFNTGVVFSRSPEFWGDVLTDWRSKGENDWMSEQRSVYSVIKAGKYRVKILDGMAYNYPPKDAKDTHEAAIVHYKGGRKHWLWELSTNGIDYSGERISA